MAAPFGNNNNNANESSEFYTKAYTGYYGSRSFLNPDSDNTVADPAAGAAIVLPPRYIFLDSSYRDSATNPSANHFAVDLSSPMRQVSRVRVLRGTFPDVPALTQSAVFLDIDGISTNIEVPQTGASFAVPLGFVPGLTSATVSLDTGLSGLVIQGSGVRERLTKLTVSLRTLSGELVTLAPDNNWSVLMEFTQGVPPKPWR